MGVDAKKEHTMIVRSLDDLAGTDRDLAFLLEPDVAPCAVTHETVPAGSESHFSDGRGAETYYCVRGEGEVVSDGARHPLRTGVLYSLEQGEVHVLRATTELHLVRVHSLPEGPERRALVGIGPRLGP